MRQTVTLIFNAATVCMLIALLSAPGVYAGITGKIAGTVIGARDNEPLPGVNIIVEGTAFGNCAPSYHTGDLEYLVFASCQTLSIADSAGHAFWYYWFHNNSTKLSTRPFTGLHMALGFRTNHTIHHWEFLWWSGNNSADFFDAFAEYLDDGTRVLDAWLDATADELSFDDGKNRTAVIYLEKYQDDTINSSKHDYIYGNPEYAGGRQWVTYWE